MLVKKYEQKISCSISLTVDKEIIIKRVLGRVVCTKCGLTFNKYFNASKIKDHNCGEKYLEIRSDDSENTVINRFDIYTKETLPLLNYYADQKKLHKIDGTRKINKIYDEICNIITSLET